jgi:hypothetical protein
MMNQQMSPTGAGNRFILLGAPSHDDLTEYTSTLLEEFPNLGLPTVLFKFTTPIKYDYLLTQCPIPPPADVLLIFCGHGEDSALQGPGANPGASNYRKLRSDFYTDSYLHLGPTFMLAFCCKAGLGLGDSYDRKTTGNTFVGYEDNLYLVMADGAYADCWKKILCDIALAMLTATNDESLGQAIRDAYKAALSAFPPQDDSKYEWGLMMRAYLRKQMETISFVRT